MNALSSGIDDIVSDSGQTIGSLFVMSISTFSYTDQSVTRVPGTSITSDINYQVDTQSFSLLETDTATITLNLSCSFSGSTSITYSMSSYMSSNIPSFVLIDFASGTLTVSAPSVDSDT